MNAVVAEKDTVEGYPLLRSALALFGRAPADLDPPELEQARTQAERELAVEGRVLASREAETVQVPEAVVEKALENVAERYDDADAFEQALAQEGLDRDRLAAALERELRVEAVIEQVAAREAAVSDDEVAIFYLQHPEKFTRPETRRARHILITVNPDFPENSPEAARARLEALLPEAQQRVEAFAGVAERHSECPSALEGGVIGDVPRGKLYPALDAALFEMAPGEVAGPLESDVGYHLLLCESVTPSETATLEQAAPRIREALEERKRRIVIKRWLADVGA